MARITLSRVSKTYPGGAQALRRVDLDVADGELVVLAGPSGCGKTTALRLVAGLDSPSGGEIAFDGRRMNDAPPAKRSVAMVFQDHALYPHLTVRRNLEFGLGLRRTPEAERSQRVASAAEILGLQSLLDRRPQELSGGQRQRVALGRSIVRQPRAFLFDEPLSSLDAKLRGEMRSEIAALHRRLGATMLYVTHDQIEAMTLGQRLVLLDDGEVRQTGPPIEVYLRPANRFAATFVGSPAMNLFEGVVQAGVFRGGAGEWPLDPAPALAGLAGPAVLGVRAEDLLLVTDENAAAFARAQLRTVERLGHETLLHCCLEAGAGDCVVRLPGDAGGWVGSVRLAIRAGRCHLFAADEAGERLN
ncbi:Trehalose import ATP-binding protein SugC [Pseudobythopirellula maris]|uniref:Trehalose import ATP-binding protein SugC n=1 Tax=Pseudobythopirellula maris TaxID=2527991 RepID=A0A5C5ZWP5_9BACT|nr:ATP-binding cassette domain-containing protein [Pseudobythopirellula maris]TWT90703.1 Trehalose import ATP-binding protein SugC [Pseudobythopirellula maris]